MYGEAARLTSKGGVNEWTQVRKKTKTIFALQKWLDLGVFSTGQTIFLTMFPANDTVNSKMYSSSKCSSKLVTF